MAHKATTWAYELDIDNANSKKFVLVALADMADESFSCYPGQDRLAQMTGTSTRTVRRAVAELEALGLISRLERRRADGYRTSDRYILNVGASPANLSPDNMSAENDSHRPNLSTSPAKSVDLTGQPVRYIEEEPPVELPGEPPTGADAPWNAQRLVAEWIDHCPRRPPGRVVGQVAKELGIMLDEGIPYNTVRQGLALWHSKALHPSTLASVVMEVMNPRLRVNRAQQRQADNLAVVAQLGQLELGS